MKADLHCHSAVSDGTLEPEVLAARAKANGVELWALTDHDEIGGLQRAMGAAACRTLLTALLEEQPERSSLEFPMDLIVRQSTGPAPSR